MDVVRSLFHTISLIKGAKPKKDGGSRIGQAWDENEGDELKEAFVNGAKAIELAKKHQRTPGAIRSRLKKLGLMDENENRVQ